MSGEVFAIGILALQVLLPMLIVVRRRLRLADVATARARINNKMNDPSFLLMAAH